MSSSDTNKKEPKKLTQPTSIMLLPHDVLFKCFASVSRLYYPTISLVSKRFQSLIYSPEIYKVCSLLGNTESCLYVCIGNSSTSNRSWFTLCRKPDKTRSNDIEYHLSEVTALGSPCVADFSNLVAVGSNIYKIGESFTSSSVSILDCRTHTWREGPRLRMKLMSLTASVIDEKIFVAGCDASMTNSFHVLDTRREIWDHEPITPCDKAAKSKFIHSKSACVDGKFHMKSFGGEVAYKPKEGRWDMVGRICDRFVGPTVGNFLSNYAYCEIGNVLFCVLCGVIGWYDTKLGGWNGVEGLVGLPQFASEDSVRLADYDGKIAVFWETKHLSHGTCTIWCAVIKLERRKNGEFWGNVEWSDPVLTLLAVCGLVKALRTTV